MSKLRVGVVGMGGISGAHVPVYLNDPRCELVAICDRDEKWLAHCKDAYRAKYAFSTWEELVACDEVDALSVCLPTIFHAPVTVAALDAGKHVLCEKPMAQNLEAAQAMAAASKRSGKTLMVSYNQRLGGDIQYLKQYVDEGHLGDIYFARTGWRRAMGILPAPSVDRATGAYNRNWFNEKAMGGGVCSDLGSHVLDLALYLMGFPKVKQVVGCTYTKFLPQFLAGTGLPSDADDHSVGFVKFENGASLQFEASFGCYVERETIFQALYGDRGGAHREIGQPVKLFTQTSGAYSTVVPNISLPAQSPVAHFVDVIVDGVTPIITPEQGVMVTEILDGFYKSYAE